VTARMITLEVGWIAKGGSAHHDGPAARRAGSARRTWCTPEGVLLGEHDITHSDQTR
jgi:hypothetical protein